MFSVFVLYCFLFLFENPFIFVTIIKIILSLGWVSWLELSALLITIQFGLLLEKNVKQMKKENRKNINNKNYPILT